MSKSGLISTLLILLYAAFLIVGSFFGAALVLLAMATIGRSHQRAERAHAAQNFVSDPDNDLGNDWPWKDCP